VKFLSIANPIVLLSVMVFSAGGPPAIAQTNEFSGEQPGEPAALAIAELPKDGSLLPAAWDVQTTGENAPTLWAAHPVNSAELLTGTEAIALSDALIHPGDRRVLESPAPVEENPPVLAQRDREIRLGRTSRGVGNYVGPAINIGLNDQGSPLGRGSFALISKIGLAEQVSLRPSVLFGEHLMLLVPVTIDFPFADTEDTLQVNLAPYLGSGIALSTDSDNPIGFFGTAGIDRVLFNRFTATAALNVGYVEELEIGIFVGGGYRF
jgi:hypothetical protein